MFQERQNQSFGQLITERCLTNARRGMKSISKDYSWWLECSRV